MTAERSSGFAPGSEANPGPGGRAGPAGEAGGPIVRTVLGDLDPHDLGLVLAHEHLVATPPAFVTDPDLTLDDVNAAEGELREFSAVGGGAVVEMTTVDYGRDVHALANVSRKSGVHVVAATGFNQGKFADRIVAKHSDDEIVRWMVSEVEAGALRYAPPEGIDLTGAAPARSNVKAGLIKASSGADGPSEGELRGLRAAAQAHRATGAPIGTHTTKAVWAFEQVELFRAAGVSLRKVLIGHLDFRPDVEWLKELADTGVMLGFDQFSKSKYLSDEKRVALVVALASAGYLGSMLLSGDLARRSYWRSYSGPKGPGFVHIPTTVLEMLRAEGFRPEHLRTLFVENAAGWLAFEPRGVTA